MMSVGIHVTASGDRPRRAPLSWSSTETWLVLGLGLLLLAVLPDTAEARLYRWIDQNGVVHYTDKLPPGQVERGHLELNPSGLRIDAVPPSPSREEIEQERVRERQRAEEKRRFEQQRAADEALFRNFRSIEDVRMMQAGKLAQIDSRVQVVRAEIRREQKRLLGLLDQSAAENAGQEAVTGTQTNEMARIQQRILRSYAGLIAADHEKARIREEFTVLVERFRALTGEVQGVSLPTSMAATEPDAHRILACEERDQCERWWASALAYLRHQATTPPRPLATGLLTAEHPGEREDRWLTLAWIDDADGASYLLLDLQCVNRLTGDLICREQDALDLVKGFTTAATAAIPDESDSGSAADIP